MRGDTGAAPAVSATEPCPSCGKDTCVAMKLGPQRDMSWGRGSSSVLPCLWLGHHTDVLCWETGPTPARTPQLSPSSTSSHGRLLGACTGTWSWVVAMGTVSPAGNDGFSSSLPRVCLRNGIPSAPRRFPKSGLHSGDQSSCSVKGLLCPLQGRRALGWEAGTRTPDPLLCHPHWNEHFGARTRRKGILPRGPAQGPARSANNEGRHVQH